MKGLSSQAERAINTYGRWVEYLRTVGGIPTDGGWNTYGRWVEYLRTVGGNRP